MLVIQQRRAHTGSGFAKFLTTHKDTITNLADVVGKVSKATGDTATAAKQIYDVIKSRNVKPEINKVLTDKSNDILARLSAASASNN